MASMGDTIFASMIILIVIFSLVIVLILALALGGTGNLSQSDVHSSDMSPVANLDQDVVLSCFLRSRPASGDVSVTWTKEGLSGLVYSYKSGNAVLKDQNSAFRDRTQLFHDAIASGNVSLSLRRVRESDRGVYSCEVNANGTVDIDLRVAAFSAPSFAYASGSDALAATAPRWLPKPNVSWVDLDGKALNGTTTFSQTSSAPGGVFSVVSTLRPVSQNSTYTCRIRNTLVRVVAEATITGKGVSVKTFFTYNAAASPTVTSKRLSLITCFLLSVGYLT